MHGRTLIIAIALLCVASAASTSEPFRVSIVPDSNYQEPSISSAPEHPDTFYVVLTNISLENQPVWRTSNSWGYRTIRFELILPDGTIHEIRKAEHDFTRNGPGYFVIPPGENQVYPIQLDASWANIPTLVYRDPETCLLKGTSTPVRFRAVYEVEPSAEAVEMHVWVGTVVSKEYAFTLRQWEAPPPN